MIVRDVENRKKFLKGLEICLLDLRVCSPLIAWPTWHLFWSLSPPELSPRIWNLLTGIFEDPCIERGSGFGCDQ